MRGPSAASLFRVSYSRLPKVELFVDGFAGGGENERMRAKIVAGELFDNLVTHGRGLVPPYVLIVLRAGPPFTVTLRYRCSNFDDFVRALDGMVPEKGKKAEPRYDASAGFYRGFGLAMCGRLISSFRLRRGLLWNSVSVVF